jgi:hypothetical protein
MERKPIKIEKGVVPIFYHVPTLSLDAQAQLLKPGEMQSYMKKVVAEIRKTDIGRLLVDAGKDVKEGKEYEDARLLAVNAIFNKQAFPRSLDGFQLMAGVELHHNMKVTTALEPLNHIGLCGSQNLINKAEAAAVDRMRSFTQLGMTSIDVFDNCDYSQGRRDFAPDSRPVFINTVNLMQIKHQLPNPTKDVWKPRVAAENIDDWIDTHLFLPAATLSDLADLRWQHLQFKFDHGHRVSRPTVALKGAPEWHILTPIVPGDEKNPAVAGDPGYTHSFGKPSEMERVLKVLHRNGISDGKIETRIGYGDEQAFETSLKVRFSLKPQ